MGYSKVPEQPQSSARPICHSHTMTRTGHEPATIRIAAWELAALCTEPRETPFSSAPSHFHGNMKPCWEENGINEMQ